MSELNFTEEDKQKLVEFLNFIATNAKFTVTTEELIKYFKLLSHMQQQVLPKLNANILEVKRVVDAPKEAAEEPKSGRTKK